MEAETGPGVPGAGSTDALLTATLAPGLHLEAMRKGGRLAPPSLGLRHDR